MPLLSSSMDDAGDGEMHTVGPSRLVAPASPRSTTRTQSSQYLSQSLPLSGEHKRQRPALPNLLTNNDRASEFQVLSPRLKSRAGSQYFSKVEDATCRDDEHQNANQSCRRGIKKIQNSTATDVLVGLLILIDVYLGCYSIDLNASGNDTPSWLTGCSMLFFGIYALELLATPFVPKSDVFGDRWILLDAEIVFGGCTGLGHFCLGSRRE
ncbi:unnamed protein product [Polarella glacialis]|uniref:Uncharacterized protein n=1 Tax=Polarella glacialis TaxID=89957 RepID=A0A813KRJ0_POLGL|nr:unnamed protein product [Polarella glacialis]